MQSVSICVCLCHGIPPGGWGLVGSHHVWAKCISICCCTTLQFCCIIHFFLGTTHLTMPNFDVWHLASLLPTQHGHSCHHLCVVLQQLDIMWCCLGLCIWAVQHPLHITPHESGICVTPCTSSVSLTTSCPTSWD